MVYCSPQESAQDSGWVRRVVGSRPAWVTLFQGNNDKGEGRIYRWMEETEYMIT